jgi:hypothetical protein
MDQELIEDVMETYSTLNVLFSIKLGVWNLYHYMCTYQSYKGGWNP